MGRKNRPQNKKAKRRKRGFSLGDALDTGLDYMEKGIDMIDRAGEAYDKAARLGKKIRGDFKPNDRCGFTNPDTGDTNRFDHQAPRSRQKNEYGFYVHPQQPQIRQIPRNDPPSDHQNQESAPKRNEMTIEHARGLLGLEPTDTREDMERKWRELIKVAHPDLGGDNEITHMLVMAKKRMLDYYYKGV